MFANNKAWAAWVYITRTKVERSKGWWFFKKRWTETVTKEVEGERFELSFEAVNGKLVFDPFPIEVSPYEGTLHGINVYAYEKDVEPIFFCEPKVSSRIVQVGSTIQINTITLELQ